MIMINLNLLFQNVCMHIDIMSHRSFIGVNDHNSTLNDTDNFLNKIYVFIDNNNYLHNLPFTYCYQTSNVLKKNNKNIILKKLMLNKKKITVTSKLKKK